MIRRHSRARNRSELPFVYVNFAMTADGKIASANRKVSSVSSKTDREHMMELRAQADAVMAGARTVDLFPVSLGPGAKRYRQMRLRNSLAEYNLRIIVSGSGSVDPKAKIFKKRFSPIIILTTAQIPKRRMEALQRVGAEVKICGRTAIDFAAAFRWLKKEWKVKRLLCEGGGELHGALVQADLVDELHLTICPKIMGGRDAPTIADGANVTRLADARQFKLASSKRIEDEMFLVYRR
jgi:riboflavin-specific deaminase-like protein